MTRQYRQPQVWIAISLLLALLAPAQTPADSSLPEGDRDAAIALFNRLAKESGNPYVSAMARENAARLSGSPAETAKGRHEIPLFTQPDNSIAVPAMINQKAMGTFIVDTGSSYTVITPRMARKLGLEINASTPRTAIITANGVIHAPVVTLKNVMIGQVQVPQVEAVVQDLGKDVLLAGLLGMNFFKGKSITIRPDKLILEDKTAPPRLSIRSN